MSLLKILKKTILTKSAKPTVDGHLIVNYIIFLLLQKIFYNINIYFYLRKFLYKIKQSFYDNK